MITINTPPMGNRYIIETPNQLWGGYSWDNTYHVALYQRGGAKLKIYQLADDGKRVEVKS